MSIQRYTVEAAPEPVTPYSHAVAAEGLLFVTGQVGNDPRSPTLLPKGITAQTHQVFANLKAVLDAAGADFRDVVFARIFLTRFKKDYPVFNRIYNASFADPAHLPARTTIGVRRLALGARVEIDLVVRVAPRVQ
jgi:reactive intermediate/imine deaminase